jgi:hypothetical protein
MLREIKEQGANPSISTNDPLSAGGCQIMYLPLFMAGFSGSSYIKARLFVQKRFMWCIYLPDCVAFALLP